MAHFGFNHTPPFVNSQACTTLTAPYQGFIPTCDPTNATTGTLKGGSLAASWGGQLQSPPSGNPVDILNYLPSVAEIEAGAPLFAFADYNRANKLPYTINNSLDIQWQPRNDVAIDIGYVGNLGRHLVVPIPFNQAHIASPSHPINGQYYTYGYTVVDTNFHPTALPPLPSGTTVGNYLSTYEAATSIFAFLTLATDPTFFSGKWHLGESDNALPNAHGFDEMKYAMLYHLNTYTYADPKWFPSMSPELRALFEKVTTGALSGNAGEKPHQEWRVNGEYDNTPERLSRNCFLDEYIEKASIDYLERAAKRGQPFFMSINFMKVHQPNLPHPDYIHKSMSKSKCADSIVEADARIDHDLA